MSNKLPQSRPAVLNGHDRAPAPPRTTGVLDSLPYYLARLYHGFVVMADRLGASAAGMPRFRPGAGSVYFTVLENEGCTVSELAQWLHIPKPTITGLIDGLERDGVIERTACEKDGRSVRLRLTKAGRSLENRLRERHAEAVSTLEAGLSAAEARELRRMLRTVLGNLDRVRESGGAVARSTRKPRKARRT